MNAPIRPLPEGSPMTTKKALDLQCEALHVDLIETGDAIQVWAPTGFLFRANGCHCITNSYEYLPHVWPERPRKVPGTMQEARACLARQLAMGLEPCDDTGCCMCEENRAEDAR